MTLGDDLRNAAYEVDQLEAERDKLGITVGDLETELEDLKDQLADMENVVSSFTGREEG